MGGEGQGVGVVRKDFTGAPVELHGLGPQGGGQGLDYLLLTHFHSDHIDGLGELATVRWVQGGNTEPLPVIGPTGVEQVVGGFDAAYAQDAVYRNDHHGDRVAPLTGHGMTPQSFETPEDGELVTAYEAGGVKIQMLKAVENADMLIADSAKSDEFAEENDWINRGEQLKKFLADKF